MKPIQRVAILAFSLYRVFGQVNIYNPHCAADGSDQTSCFTKAFRRHQTVAVGPGNYTIAGTLYMQTTQTVVGAGPTQTILKFTCSVAPCTNTGAAVGIVIASSSDKPAGDLGGGLGGLRHLTVFGPGLAANWGSTYEGQPIGVFLGLDPNGKINDGEQYGDSVRLEDVVIAGWAAGVQFGSNSWSDTFQHVRLNGNSVGIYAPTGLSGLGEKIVVSDCQFVNGPGNDAPSYGILDKAGLEWMIDSSTFDFLNGPSIIVAGSNPEGNHLNISHSHFETGTLSDGFITNLSNQAGDPAGTPTISIQDTTFLVDNQMGSNAAAMINTTPGVSQLNIVGGWVDSRQSMYFVNGAASMWIQSVAGNATRNLTGKIVLNAPDLSLISNVFGGGFNGPR